MRPQGHDQTGIVDDVFPHTETKRDFMKNICGSQDYDNSFIFSLNGMLRNVHGLVQKMIADLYSDTPLRVAIHGVGTPGWLVASVMAEYRKVQPVMYIDQSAAKLQEMNAELSMLRPPALPVQTSTEADTKSFDVILSSVNPHAHSAVAQDLEKNCPGIPRYFLNYDENMECIHRRGKPLLIVTASRCGTIWFWRMCRLASFYSGYAEVSPVDENNEFDYEMPAKLAFGQYTVSHHRLRPNIRSLLDRGQVHPTFLYRDPRDIIVSKFYYSHRMNPTREFIFDAKRYQEVVDHIREWTSFPDIWQMQFEDLKVDPVGVFGRFCEHVGWDVAPERIEDIVNATTFKKMTGRANGKEDKASHFRKGISGDWVNHFDEHTKDMVKEISGDLLVSLGYEKDLNW